MVDKLEIGVHMQLLKHELGTKKLFDHVLPTKIFLVIRRHIKLCQYATRGWMTVG